MTKERLVKLQSYLDQMTNRLSSSVPAKHKGHPEAFRAFLKNEIAATKGKIDAAKLEGVSK